MHVQFSQEQNACSILTNLGKSISYSRFNMLNNFSISLNDAKTWVTFDALLFVVHRFDFGGFLRSLRLNYLFHKNVAPA